MKRLVWIAAWLAVVRCALAELPVWDAAAETVVIYNINFPESEELARMYARGRGVPDAQLVGLTCSKEEVISRQEFEYTMVKPLAQYFLAKGWMVAQMRDTQELRTRQVLNLLTVVEQKMRVLVLIHGIPLKIKQQVEGVKAMKEDAASVDAELAGLGLPIAGTEGGVPNPYYGKRVRFPQMGGVPGMFLVGRLDAASPMTVRRMMGDALAMEEKGLLGRAVVDLALKTGAYEQGEEWLRRSVAMFRAAGVPVWVDRRAEVLRSGWPLPDTALYFGWYTGEVAGAMKDEGFRFARGAVACHLHSFSASTLRNKAQNWCAPLLEHGAAAALGNVWEPYLTFTVHFDILNERLLQGYTLAEAAWAATPLLSWMNVVVGDPLYRPFAVTSMGEGPLRDYALYQAMVLKHGKSTVKLKQEMVKLAEERKAGHLLELLALLADAEAKLGEAIRLMEHAGALHLVPKDKLRAAVYEVEMLLRSGSAEEVVRAKELRERLLQSCADQKLQEADGYAEYVMLEQLLK